MYKSLLQLLGADLDDSEERKGLTGADGNLEYGSEAYSAKNLNSAKEDAFTPVYMDFINIKYEVRARNVRECAEIYNGSTTSSASVPVSWFGFCLVSGYTGSVYVWVWLRRSWMEVLCCRSGNDKESA